MTRAQLYERLAAARGALQSVTSEEGIAARALLAKHLDAVTSKKAKASTPKATEVARQARVKVAAGLKKLETTAGIGEDRGVIRQAEDLMTEYNEAKTPEEARKVLLQAQENQAQLRQEVERHDRAALQKAKDLLTWKAVREKAAEVVNTAKSWGGGLLLVAALIAGAYLLSKKGH